MGWKNIVAVSVDLVTGNISLQFPLRAIQVIAFILPFPFAVYQVLHQGFPRFTLGHRDHQFRYRGMTEFTADTDQGAGFVGDLVVVAIEIAGEREVEFHGIVCKLYEKECLLSLVLLGIQQNRFLAASNVARTGIHSPARKGRRRKQCLGCAGRRGGAVRS